MRYHIQPRTLAVASDSHGSFDALEQILLENPKTDGFLFLGDGMREFEDLQGLYPNLPMVGVPGNCDWSSRGPLVRIYQDHDLRLMLTHGHQYYVKAGLEYLLDAARDQDATAVLFGHTHKELLRQEDDGLWVINPGSLGYSGTYALLEISENGISAKLKEL